MIVITGATGNTGRPTVEALLAAGEKIRVIGHHAEKLQPFAAKGAEPFVGDVQDPDAMTRAFTGASVVYALIPSNVSAPDLHEYETAVAESYAIALERAKVTHVVNLSSVGAQLPAGAGPVSELHHVEQRFNRIAGLNILHLRPTYFFENIISAVMAYRSMGFFAGLLKGDLPFPMIAAKDVGARVAQLLRARDFTGQQTQELLGQRDLKMNEAAAIFGAAIGKPGLTYTQAPVMMAKPAMMQSGMSANFADKVIEMCKAINDGVMVPLEPRSPKNTTPTTFERFAAEVLAPIFKGQSASA